MIEVLAAHYAMSGVLTLAALLVVALIGIALNLRADRQAANAVAAGLPDQPMWTFEDLLGVDPAPADEAPRAPVTEPAVEADADLAYGRHSEASERLVPAEYEPRHALAAAAGGPR